MAKINEEKYKQVLLWEEDVLEDREQSLRMGDNDELAQAFHRRLQEVKSELRNL